MVFTSRITLIFFQGVQVHHKKFPEQFSETILVSNPRSRWFRFWQGGATKEKKKRRVKNRRPPYPSKRYDFTIFGNKFIHIRPTFKCPAPKFKYWHQIQNKWIFRRVGAAFFVQKPPGRFSCTKREVFGCIKIHLFWIWCQIFGFWRWVFECWPWMYEFDAKNCEIISFRKVWRAEIGFLLVFGNVLREHWGTGVVPHCSCSYSLFL